MSAGLSRPLCVVGDVHLGHGERNAVGIALGALVRAHAGHEIILNGDSFDLSVEPQSASPVESVPLALSRNATLLDALRAHLSEGHPLTLVAGNHDAALAAPELRLAVLSALELSSDAPMRIEPWFVRRGAIHVEHGHLYDPDNAPTHPLATWSRRTEPLGVALTRRFVAPAGATHFAHSDETTPLAGFLRTFRLYGPRAPVVVARYYATAAQLTWEAGVQSEIDEERRRGAHAIEEHAALAGVDADALRALALSGARPTRHDRVATFQRLYLDRSLATAAVGLGVAGALAGTAITGGIAAVAAAYLGFSIAKGTNRYGGQLEQRLEDAAAAVRELTGASFVVFGHTHRLRETQRYSNPGSFAYPPAGGRGYVVVSSTERVELRRWTD